MLGFSLQEVGGVTRGEPHENVMLRPNRGHQEFLTPEKIVLYSVFRNSSKLPFKYSH